ncbi:hypothetical protein ACS0PU_001395 [Formica fusca]
MFEKFQPRLLDMAETWCCAECDENSSEKIAHLVTYTIGLFFTAELAAPVQSTSFSFQWGEKKINSEPVQPVQLQRTDPMLRRM